MPRYIIFEIPILVALLLYITQLGGETDHDVNHDMDHDVDHDTNHGTHHHIGDADSDHVSHPFMGFLELLGLGKVPLSFALSTLFFLWGFSGLITLILIELVIPIGWISFLPAVIVAAFTSIFGTSKITSQLAKYVPKLETYGISAEEHVGRPGTVRFKVTENSGSVQFYDKRNSFHEVEARVGPGATVIPSGMEVVLMGYDRDRRTYVVLTRPQYLAFLGSE